MAVILPALVPIYFVLLLGFTAGKRGVVKSAHVAGLNAVVMSYALPASLLAATAATPRAFMLEQWPLPVTLVVAMMLIYPLWYLLQRRVLRRSVSESAMQPLLARESRGDLGGCRRIQQCGRRKNPGRF